MTRGSRHYVVEGWERGSCVWYARATQARAVARHVEVALVDNDADYVWVTFYPGTGSVVEIAQVTKAGFWKWHDAPEAARLRAYVESER